MQILKKSDIVLTRDQIKEWLIALRDYCYHPSSGFAVTSVFRAKAKGDDAHYYFAGVNVENFDNRLSTHAEEGSIAAMITTLGKSAEITEGWVMGAPLRLNPGDDDPLANNNVTCCGKCRQQIAEFAEGNVIIHSVSLNGEFKQTTVDKFLPDAFCFKDFSTDMIKHTNASFEGVSQKDLEKKLIRHVEKALSEKEIFHWLEQLESIDYASKAGQAVVLKLEDNHYVAGVNIENAAYISISPMQCAIANAKTICKTISVEQVWVITQVRNDNFFSTFTSEEKNFSLLKEFKQAKKSSLVVAKACQPLTFSSLQILSQFAKNDNIPIHLLNSDGSKSEIQFNESFQFPVTFPREKIPT